MKPGINFFHTVTFRLSLWYTVVFSGLSLVVFLVVYVSLISHLRQATDNELLDKVKEFDTLYKSDGLGALQDEFNREAESKGIKQVFFYLLSPEGKVLANSDMSNWRGIKIASLLKLNSSQPDHTFMHTFSPHKREHSVRVISKITNNGNILEVGTALRGNDLMMESYRETFGTALGIMIVCGSFMGWLLARKAMSGVQRVTHTAIQIGKGDLSSRVPAGNEGQEIHALACAFNDMLERLESLVKELKQITNDVAHELRTPITRMRGIAETTLNGSNNLNEYKEMAASVIEQSDRLVEMINTMLEIAKTDSGVTILTGNPLNMRDIAEEAVDLFRPLAEDKGIDIRLDIPKEDVIVMANRPKIQRAIANILDNAVKYTPAGGNVSVKIETNPDNVRIIIADTGSGIAEKDIPHIFERFYRADKSRSTPGSGLGLSLATAIIRAYGGNITVKSIFGTANSGSIFTVSLPRVSNC